MMASAIARKRQKLNYCSVNGTVNLPAARPLHPSGLSGDSKHPALGELAVGLRAGTLGFEPLQHVDGSVAVAPLRNGDGPGCGQTFSFTLALQACGDSSLVHRPTAGQIGSLGGPRLHDAGNHSGQDGHHQGSTSPRWVNEPVGPDSSSSAIPTLLFAPVTTSSAPLLFISVCTEPGWIALTLIAVSRNS